MYLPSPIGHLNILDGQNKVLDLILSLASTTIVASVANVQLAFLLQAYPGVPGDDLSLNGEYGLLLVLDPRRSVRAQIGHNARQSSITSYLYGHVGHLTDKLGHQSPIVLAARLNVLFCCKQTMKNSEKECVKKSKL